jgi:hypothetical protein
MLEGIRRAGTTALLVAGLLFTAPQLASAVPITYFFQAGSVTVSVTTGPNTLLVVPNEPLDGDWVTFDAATPELTDIQLQVNSAGPFTLNSPYAGYDTVSVTNAHLSPAPGYTGPAVLQVPGPPVDNYSYTGGPVKVTGVLSISDSTLTNPPQVIPFNVVNPGTTGTLLVNTVTGNIALLGITISNVGPFGLETNPLIIKGDFFFRGMVPEPGTVVLLGAGLVGVLAVGRRARG